MFAKQCRQTSCRPFSCEGASDVPSDIGPDRDELFHASDIISLLHTMRGSPLELRGISRRPRPLRRFRLFRATRSRRARDVDPRHCRLITGLLV